jgi:hypothetical protein
MQTSVSAGPSAATLRFGIKSQIDGLGSLIVAIVHHRGHKLWLEAVFLPLDLEETLREFREAFRTVFPDITPPTFNLATTAKPIGAR